MNYDISATREQFIQMGCPVEMAFESAIWANIAIAKAMLTLQAEILCGYAKGDIRLMAHQARRAMGLKYAEESLGLLDIAHMSNCFSTVAEQVIAHQKSMELLGVELGKCNECQE